ncbi:hypothetical protein FDECE_14457 [Fusarium decemcellulare]|nr:hypothetical protein FDECE_14457 [Fusarium decemcellulare]
MNNEDILKWLESTQEPANSDHPVTRSDNTAKRLKTNHYRSSSRLPTPVHSGTDNSATEKDPDYLRLGSMSSPGKRKRQGCDESIEDPFASQEAMDQTPRANPAQVRQNSSSLPSSSSSMFSLVSHRTSPTKQYRNAELQRIFRPESFNVNKDRLPNSLRELRQGLIDINGGEKIIPSIIKEKVDEQDQKPRLVTRWSYPPADLVEETLHCADRCLADHDGESSWNHDVHGPILKWVFGPRRHRPLVDYRYCTTAQLINKFKTKHAPAKMVDYCIIIRPEDDGPEYDAIEALCGERPDQTINHTDWGSFSKNPIAISIETKRHLENWDKAMLQIGTWHSSQWQSLLWGKESPLVSLQFIPGIIVQGHQWRFVASTFNYKNSKTTLYHSVEIGDTETELGIYKIMMSLQYLKTWVEKVYWPAFKTDMLRMDN